MDQVWHTAVLQVTLYVTIRKFATTTKLFWYLEAYWLIGAGELSEGYVARVQARNKYGWSRLSPAAELDAAPLAYAAAPHPAALAVAVAALAALVLCVAAAVFYS